jgi:putative transposase
MSRQAYNTDLNDREWDILKALLPLQLGYGRPLKCARREIVNAMLDVLRTGCQWHLLPHDFLPYKTVYDYYRQWRRSGMWERVNTVLRE